MILKLLQANPTEWIGAENAKLLLQAVLETRSTLRDESLPQHLCACIMEPLAKLSEEELKASPTFHYFYGSRARKHICSA
jgi:hypothetical protein